MRASSVRLIPLIIAISIGALMFGFSYTTSGVFIEYRLFDLMLRLRSPQPVSKDVVIIFIGDDTVQTLGAWPLTRDYYVSLIQILTEFEARIIAFDLLFAEHDSREEKFDDALAAVAAQNGRVYLPYYLLTHANAPVVVSEPVSSTPFEFTGVEAIPTQQLNFPIASDGIFPISELRTASHGMGHINVHLDSDGIIRRHPLFINYNNALYPSLGLVVACNFLGRSQNDIRIQPDHTVEIDAGHRIPMDNRGNVLINFTGPLSEFENYSLLQVLQSYKQYSLGQKPFIPLETFKDKIVVIGMTATGATDFNPTPISALYPLVGTQATVISNILTNNYLRYAAGWVSFSEIMLVVGLLTGLLTRLRLPAAVGLTALLVIAVAGIHFWLVNRQGVYLNFVPVLSTILLSLIGQSIYLFQLEFLNRERMRQRLALAQEELDLKVHQIGRIETALNHKNTEIETLIKTSAAELDQSTTTIDALIKVAEEETQYSTRTIEALRRDREVLQNERQSLQAEKAALTEKIELMRGVARTYIFDQQKSNSRRETLRGRYTEIVGENELLINELQKVDRAAPYDSNILITGESGTGKELIARAVHQNSPRRGPLVIVNCAAVPSELIESELFGHEKGSFTGAAGRRPGKFELADHGTLFLDEIGDMPAAMQAKILRAIQQREFRRVGGTQNVKVNVRLIAATNKNLEEEVKNNTFREDLFHRLNVIPIRLPALRERKEDLPQLVERFLDKKSKAGQGYTLTQGVMGAFEMYHWPGNIRELEQTLERMCVLADDVHLTIRDLPAEIAECVTRQGGSLLDSGAEIPLKEALEDFERHYLLKKMAQYNWNTQKAADALGMSRRNLSKKLQKHGVSRDESAESMDDNDAPVDSES